MKIRVKVIEETTYELDVTPEEFCIARAYFSENQEFHDRVLIEGKIMDLSRTWEKIINMEPEKLEEFFDKRA